MMDGHNDALSLEYKLDYGCARGNLNISDFVNDAALQRIGGVLRSRIGCLMSNPTPWNMNVAWGTA